MPALSKKQQKFMGIVRSIQKGEQPASEFSKDAQDAAKDMKKSSVKKFAKTKHKGLPTKVKKEDILNKLKETIKEELKDYTYGSGDIVKDVNPTCPHYGAMGKVKSVNPRSVVFVVMNKGKNFKPGQELEKSHDQMKKMNESLNEMSAKTKKIINKLNKKEKEMFMDMVDMLGFDQVMADYKRDKKAFKQALKDMTEGFASAAQRRAAFASGYEAKGKKKKKKESVNEASLSKVSNGVEFSKRFLQGLDLVIKQAQGLKGPLAKHPVKRDLNKLKAVQTLFKRFLQPEINAYKFNLEAPDINDIKKGLSSGKFASVIEYNLKVAIEQDGFRGNSFYFLEDKTKKLRDKIEKALRDVYRKIRDAQLENINEDGHTDVASAKRKVMIMVDDSNELLSKLNGMNKEDSLPSWWTDKITLSQNYLAKAKDYLLNPVESVNEARLDPKQTLQQLGGNRFIAMTGAKNLAVDKSKNELHMKIGRNAKGVSHVRIRLTSMDLYDMEFLQVRAGRIKIKSKEKGVYADQLGKMFKKNTGMNVRL
jgi:outer membrane protein OmpA-like peptidoglycan-associated protein